jgi:hypothetical protein
MLIFFTLVVIVSLVLPLWQANKARLPRALAPCPSIAPRVPALALGCLLRVQGSCGICDTLSAFMAPASPDGCAGLVRWCDLAATTPSCTRPVKNNTHPLPLLFRFLLKSERSAFAVLGECA